MFLPSVTIPQLIGTLRNTSIASAAEHESPDPQNMSEIAPPHLLTIIDFGSPPINPHHHSPLNPVPF
jgi:hypothetical protein